MKSKLIIFLFFICCLGYSQPYIYTQTHHLVQYECSICGITIWNCEKIPVYNDYNWYYPNDNDCHWWDNKIISVSGRFTIGNDLLLCQNCYDKYVVGLQKRLEIVFNDSIDKVVKLNDKSRQKYDQQRKQEQIEELKEKQKGIQDQIDEINGKKKETGILWKPTGKIYCDTSIYPSSSFRLRIGNDTSVIKSIQK